MIKEQKFKLENFEGPLDLLLSLIKDKKLDIIDISLAIIADQYISYIEKNKKHLNLDIASEYLLIASQLLEIKAKNLLNNNTKKSKSENEKDSNDDHILIKRLIQYEKYKKASELLEQRLKNNINLEKPTNELTEFLRSQNKELHIMDSSMIDIELAIKNIYVNLSEVALQNRTLSIKRLSIEEVKALVNEKLKIVKKILFTDLLNYTDKYLIGATLLVLLELANQGKINIEQTKDYQNIEIRVL